MDALGASLALWRQALGHRVHIKFLFFDLAEPVKQSILFFEYFHASILVGKEVFCWLPTNFPQHHQYYDMVISGITLYQLLMATSL